MREQNIDRAAARRPCSRLGHVLIGNIVRLGVRLRPDAANRRQAQTSDHQRRPLRQEDRCSILILQAREQFDGIMIAKRRIDRRVPLELRQLAARDLVRIPPIPAR